MSADAPIASQVIWGDVGDAHLDVLSALCVDILLPLFFAQAKRGGLPKAAELTQLLQAFASDGAHMVQCTLSLHASPFDLQQSRCLLLTQLHYYAQ